MSQKIVIETLRGLGLTEKDSEVYIFIAKKGLLRAYDILGALKITKAQLYRSLKTLQSKGMVESTFEYPARFSAISFERVLDMFVKAKKEEAQRIEENKGFVLSQWKSLALEGTPMLFDKFMVIGGENFLYSKIGQMTKEAKKQILVSASDSSIVQAEKAGIMESMVKLGLPFKILTNVTSQNLPVIEKAIAEIGSLAVKFRGRHINITERFFPRFVIRDEDELIIIVTSGEGKTANHKSETGLWTNNRALVDSFRTFFDQLWQDATDIEKRLSEIRTGESPPETYLIRDAQEAFQKYVFIVSSAQKEVIIMTSAKGLTRALSHKPIMESWQKRKVNVRIMAPITHENESYAKELAKYCDVRNVQLNYVRTVIVDGKELLHMKAAPPDKDSLVPEAYFEDSFYTNDPAYVRGRRELLEDLWNNSADAIESLRRSEARFRSLYENSFDAVLLASPDGSILSANPAAQSIFGMSEDEIKIAGRAGLLVMDENAKTAIDERSRNGKSLSELTFRRKDGSVFQGETSSSLFTDADGKQKTSLIVRDATERKKLEKELQQFSTAIKASSDGIVMGDLNGYITYANESALKMYGSTDKNDLVGRYVTDFLAEEDKERAWQDSAYFMRIGQGSTKEYTALKKDGSVFRIEATVAFVKDESGNKIGFVDILRDVTARK